MELYLMLELYFIAKIAQWYQYPAGMPCPVRFAAQLFFLINIQCPDKVPMQFLWTIDLHRTLLMFGATKIECWKLQTIKRVKNMYYMLRFHWWSICNCSGLKSGHAKNLLYSTSSVWYCCIMKKEIWVSIVVHLNNVGLAVITPTNRKKDKYTEYLENLKQPLSNHRTLKSAIHAHTLPFSNLNMSCVRPMLHWIDWLRK